MSHDHEHEHGHSDQHDNHGGIHKIPPLHKPETLITDNEDTLHEPAPKDFSKLLVMAALALAFAAVCYAMFLHYRFEEYRLAGIGHPDPGDRYTPDWLKAQTVDKQGKPRYPELKAKEAEDKRTGKKLATASAPATDAGTVGSPAPADEDDHEEKPATTAPVTATKQSATQPAAAEAADDDGLTYLVKSGDNLTSIGQNMKPKFCGVIGDSKVPGGRPGMFAKKVMEANQSPIAKGFQALPTPTALRAGFKIKLPAECKKESSTDPPNPPAE